MSCYIYITTLVYLGVLAILPSAAAAGLRNVAHTRYCVVFVPCPGVGPRTLNRVSLSLAAAPSHSVRLIRRSDRAGLCKVSHLSICCLYFVFGECTAATVHPTASQRAARLSLVTALQLQEHFAHMAGIDLHYAGKGWLLTALLCIACTLTGAPAIAAPGGVSCCLKF